MILHLVSTDTKLGTSLWGCSRKESTKKVVWINESNREIYVKRSFAVWFVT